MAENFSDVFPLEISKTITDRKRRDKIEEKMFSTSAMTISDPLMSRDEEAEVVARKMLEHLEELKVKLDARNIKVGGVIGAGSMGVIFELLDTKGEVIKNSVLRIDPIDAINKLDDNYRANEPLAALPMLFQDESGSEMMAKTTGDKIEKIQAGFRATIVPRVDDARLPNDQIEKTLAVFNTEGKLNILRDLNADQFMKADGVDIALVGDLGSISSHVEKINAVKAFAEKQPGLDYDRILATKATDEEMATLREQKQAFMQRAVDELRADGVVIDAIPVRQNVTTLEPLAKPPVKEIQ